MIKNKVIAVDFDGTLCSDRYPAIGIENIKLIEALKSLRKDGCKLIFWTCRRGIYLDAAIHWCQDFGLEFDAVNENLPEHIELFGDDSRKIFADIYIDDRAVHPQNPILNLLR
ncbi:hypothetical protein [Lachnoclostridium sp.]|uniref:hypothetical protein n=1 Tax=Lachnoclostridium sp. TaxID=2028282 RepID=UPI002F427ADA